MSQHTDPAHLLHEQYKDPGNLNARIDLHVRFSTNRYGWFRWAFDHLSLQPNSRCLDLGCGPAKMWVENRERLLHLWSVCFSDSSIGMVTEARRALAGTSRAFEFVVADAQHVPLRDALFDFVIANHMLYHVADRPRALREIARVLAPSGCLIASTVGDGHLKEIDEQLSAVGVAPEFLGRP